MSADPLRVTVAAILMLIAIGILFQTATFVSSIIGLKGVAKWILILVDVLTCLVMAFWVLNVY
ncbi:hypothetical protein EYM_04710 [Ignicoccus islandicus DSM 13165]|uniref:Uncharacterized protein n=1 Tax=Ignicoccus islandicus DSM 13165 TaxID=940295 RepID=A0A0U2WNH8_9CREN|nr:hypothetical protein [Ignicoccus islandicus]ALU12513.1 hypothetical protein EYM_04710 [Ignicoccus islandicus DSM 13165]